VKRSRVLSVLGWGGIASLLSGVAFIAVAPQAGTSIDRHDSAPPAGTIQITESKQRIVVPANKTYGIWADDADNSGYSSDCSIIDNRGRPIDLKFFEGSVVSDSPGDFAQFDVEFNTGSGELTVLNCADSGAEFSVRPVKRPKAVGPGPIEDFGFEPGFDSNFAMTTILLIAGVQLAQLGVCLLVAWLVVRLVWKPTAS
jgi:hypothetical protein